MHEPLISVIITACHAEGVLAECVRAIKKSAGEETEIIIASDASSNHIAAIANELGCEMAQPANGKGAAACRNAGAAAAKGDILVFIDGDIMACDDAMEKIRKAFQENGCDALVGRMSPAGGRTLYGKLEAVCTSYNQGLFEKQESIAWFWAGLGAVKKKVFEAAGPFNEKCSADCDDVEFGCDLARGGYRTIMLNDLVGVSAGSPGLYPFFKNFRRKISGLTEVTLRKGRLMNYLEGPGNWRHIVAVPLCWFMAVTFVISPWWWPGGITSAVGAFILTFGIYRRMYKSLSKEHGFLVSVPSFYSHVITNLLVPFAVAWGGVLFLLKLRAPRKAA